MRANVAYNYDKSYHGVNTIEIWVAEKEET